MQKKRKISFCTVCMNRLHHLKKTLPQNIIDNISYVNVEFVVLDYNSGDGLEKWVTKELDQYLNSGVLVYLRTNKPKYFLRSHSKNIVALYATGDVICNIDADNFTGKGFADCINEHFTKHKNSYLAVKRNSGKQDCYGRICVLKKDFMAVTGYDESMTDYGFEDFDLTNRLDLLGKKAQYITDEEFLKVLNHDNMARIQNEAHFNEIANIYIGYINHFSSHLLYLFKNGTFFKGVVLINRLVNSNSIDNIFMHSKHIEYTNSLQYDAWIEGTWLKEIYGIRLKSKKKTEELVCKNNKRMIYLNNDIEYHLCPKSEVFEEMVMFLSQIKNRIKMIENKREKRIKVNNVFGKINLINR